MDDLLHHCLRELAFDGDLGSNPARLRDFVVDFYAHSSSPHAQNVDDDFCAFVWSFVVQQPNVIVGTKPSGVNTEVWVAPQTSAKRKATAKGQVLVETTPPHLDIIENAKSRSLEELVEEFGDDLRLAVDAESIYASITGSHIRMSQMVYSALQLITRGRDNGISVVELGQKSKYDQKTCFYLVKQLTDLNLVAKVRRGGVGTHFCIHKYFFDRSPSWQAIREEESKAADESVEDLIVADDNTVEVPAELKELNFTPIDARHLSSLPLVRARVVKLLKASKNQMHPSNNMLITIGFKQPTKTDRRFFQSRIRDMLQEGVVEKVVVPNRKKTITTSVTCLRLLNEEGSKVAHTDIPDDSIDIGNDEEPTGIRFNSTIHKLIIDLLEEADTAGMTLNDLSTSMCNFDRRTIELLLNRAEKCPPPEHLGDLGISGLMETSGRERRHRYFTVSAYHKLVSQEKLNESSAGLSTVDFDSTGKFMIVDPHLFYSNLKEMFAFQEQYKRAGGEEDGAYTNKKKPVKDGAPKQGRPRKRPLDEDGEAKSSRKKRKKVDDTGTSAETPAKKRTTTRGKGKGKEGNAEDGQVMLAPESAPSAPPPSAAEPKKRGRPKKNPEDDSPKLPVHSKSRPPRYSRKGPESSTVPIGNEASGDMAKVATPTVEPRAVEEEPAAPEPPVDIQMQDIDPTATLDLHLRSPPPLGLAEASVQESSPAEAVTQIANTLLPDAQNTHGLIPMEVDATAIAAFSTTVHGDESMPIDPSLLSDAPAHRITPSPSVLSTPTNGASTNRRVNVSHLRRENELFRVIEILGGIVNTHTKDMFDAHVDLLETLTKAGEPTSAPVGTRTDKRTAMATINSLSNQGRIKQLKTMVPGPAGVGRPTVIVYLPDTPEDKLNAFLADLARGMVSIPSQPVMARKLEEPVEYGPDPSLLNKTNLPLQLLQMDHTSGDDPETHLNKNTARVNELFSYDDETIRGVLLTERTTLGQFYGNIPAKALRARELHFATIRAFEEKHDFAEVVSHEHRILTLSYFCFDLPLDLYCSLLSPLFHHEELTGHLADPASRKTLVRDLPQTLRSILQIGKSRARSRFLDILELLRCLDLVTPLIEATSEKPHILLESSSGDHPTAFDKASTEGWTVNTPTTAPNFWQFKTTASLYHWASTEQYPPLLRLLPVVTVIDVEAFWNDLRDACQNSELPSSSLETTPTHAPAEDVKVVRSLKRSVSWNSKYVFTWHQTRYLQRAVDISTGKTPMDLEDGGKELDRICHVVCAPRAAVEDYFATAHQKMVKHIGRVKHRRKLNEKHSMDTQRDAAQTQAALARKAAEARQSREAEWNALVEKVHPEHSPHAAVRLKIVKMQFLQSVNKDHEKWEADIKKAFEESEAAVAQVLKPAQPLVPRVLIAAPPTVQAAVSEKSVQALISEQGVPLTPADRTTEAKRKRKRKDKDSDGEDEPQRQPRRHRFQWNKDYDELARDASIIVRARCRNGIRLDWGAFEQVFPAVPRNSVRQRLTHIRETPSHDAYLTRLEDRWYDLWMKHRGTASLPDHDVNSATNFDLIKHIEFLRRHIDKNAIRVGYAQPQGNVTASIELPGSVDELLETFDVIDTAPNLPTWDFMWNGVVEEDREKRLSSLAFTKVYGELVDHPSPDPLSVAESALKMAFGTPNEHYEAEAASDFLRSASDERTISASTKTLLSKGVLSKLVRDHHRHKPGRQLKISDANQASLGGPIASELFQDAVGLDESFTHRDDEGARREWPLLATDGDIASLIQLTSDNKLDFKVDTTGPQAARAALDWNSKKADDDQIETAVFVSFRDLTLQTLAPSQPGSPSAPSMDVDPPPEEKPATEVKHGQTVDGQSACCKKTCPEGVIDCSGCLDEQWATSSSLLTPTEMKKSQLMLWAIGQAGAKGVNKRQLMEVTKVNADELASIVQKMSDGAVALLYWVGYASLALVSAAHIASWTVVLPADYVINVFPRRWFDITGAKLTDVWEAAVRAVIGTILLRPGISQAELRWRLRISYDRQEIYDLLVYLLDGGFIRVGGHKTDGQLVQTLEDEEEIDVFYFICDSKKWYLV